MVSTNQPALPLRSFQWASSLKPGPQAQKDVLSGLTVALALVPEAVAFAFVCGVEPLVGLYAAFIMSLITSVFGGRPGMISGATGAVAVVVVALVKNHGVAYLFATVVLAGLLQMLAGVFRLGKLIRLVPEAVMLGFVNGLAIVIFLAQAASFQHTTQLADGSTKTVWMTGGELWIMLGLVVLTLLVMWLVPRVTKALPAPLTAILVVSALVIGLELPTRTVGDLASIAGQLPTLSVPSVPFNLETLKIVLPYAVVVAAVGLVESLMTLTLVDELTNTRGQTNRECLALGAANVTTGFFGGMGGCAMIGQSVININSGGRGRLSGFSASCFLLTFILFAAPLIERIPMAALTGVMFMVVIGTFEWSSFRVMRRVPRSDAAVIALVSGTTVVADLAVAVGLGVVVSALVFAWEKSHRLASSTDIDSKGRKVYRLDGPLFFGSIASFRDLFSPETDPDRVVVDFARCRIHGHAGLHALDRLAKRYADLGKRVQLVGLSQPCRTLLERAGDLVEAHVLDERRVADEPA